MKVQLIGAAAAPGLVLRNRWPDARPSRAKARSDFVTRCKEGGGTSATCHCVYDKLEARYGSDTMVRAL